MRQGIVVLFSVMVLLASCDSSRPAYTDRVKDLNPEDAHPRFVELAQLVAKRPASEALSLVTSWKRMLVQEGISAPLTAGANYTLIYFDPFHRLEQVWVETSFSAGAPIPLWRWESTGLFYRTFAISKPDKLRFRFTTSEAAPETGVLTDLLHPLVDRTDPSWSVMPHPSETQLLKVDASLEPELEGQNLQILLPPDYDRDVSRVWPLMVIVGMSVPQWHEAAQSALADGTLVPLVIVAVEPRQGAGLTAAGLTAYWTTVLKPWLDEGARVDTSSTGSFLLGWGPLARVTQDTAVLHPELFGRSWSAPAGTASTAESWNQNFVQVLKTSFIKVAP